MAFKDLPKDQPATIVAKTYAERRKELEAEKALVLADEPTGAQSPTHVTVLAPAPPAHAVWPWVVFVIIAYSQGAITGAALHEWIGPQLSAVVVSSLQK
jgi:hypothetical protein